VYIPLGLFRVSHWWTNSPTAQYIVIFEQFILIHLIRNPLRYETQKFIIPIKDFTTAHYPELFSLNCFNDCLHNIKDRHTNIWINTISTRIPPPPHYMDSKNYDITLCSPLSVSRRFRGTYHLYLQGQKISWARHQCESRSVGTQWTTLCYIPEDGTLHNFYYPYNIVRQVDSRKMK
jgi:hypothetical protein